jgi:hypothetical protein
MLVALVGAICTARFKRGEKSLDPLSWLSFGYLGRLFSRQSPAFRRSAMANELLVQHEITQALNDRKIAQNGLQSELEDLRARDPRHYLNNLQRMESITQNYQMFPHLELHDAIAEAEREKQHTHTLVRSSRPSSTCYGDARPHRT